jgi:hypothetical protein
MNTSLGRAMGLVTVCVALVLGACTPAEGTTVLPDDGPSPVVSRESAFNLIQKTVTAGQSATSERALALVLTDAEVTSFLNLRTDLMREFEGMGFDQLGQIDELQDLVPGQVDLDALRALLTQENNGGGRGLPRLRLGFHDARVHFRGEGQIVTRGDLAFLWWRQPARLVIAPYASAGEISFEFVEGQVGRTRVPQVLFDLLGRGLTSALVLGQSFGYAEITQIQVSAGTLTLSGRLNR